MIDPALSTASADPVADLRAMAAVVRAATGEARPNCVLIHPEIHKRMQARYERLRRKPLLSGRYQKRQRQRAQGIAGTRYDRLQLARQNAEAWGDRTSAAPAEPAK